MGNSNSYQTLGVASLADADNWVFSQNIGYCDVLRNKTTGEQCQQYTIPLDGRAKLLEEFQRYEFRRTQNFNLVSVLHVQKQDSKYLCSGMDFIKVKTERIPLRLAELFGVSLAESYYILQEAFEAFKVIFQRQGPVNIDDNMIGFTPTGKVKVWLNENFAKNFPEELDRESQEPSQELMVHQIYKAVEEHAVGKQLQQRLREEYSQKCGFVDAIEMLREFVEGENIIVPGRVRVPKPGQKYQAEEVIGLGGRPGSAGKKEQQSMKVPEAMQQQQQPQQTITTTITETTTFQKQNSGIQQPQSVQSLSQNFVQTGASPVIIQQQPIYVVQEVSPLIPSPFAQPPTSQTIYVSQTTSPIQNVMLDSGIITSNQDSQLRRSQSKQKRNGGASVATLKKPPLPPGHLDSSKKLRQSQTQIVTTTTTTTIPTAIPQPVLFEQRRVTTPVLIPGQVITTTVPDASVVVSTLRSSRASSSHGNGTSIVRVSSRPGSSHGIPVTVRPGSSHGLSGSRVIVTTTTTNNPIATSTVGVVGGNTTIINGSSQIRPSRIGVDATPAIQAHFNPTELVRRESRGTGAAAYTSDSMRVVPQPDGSALVQNLKKELVIETKPITPSVAPVPVIQKRISQQQLQPTPVTFVYNQYPAQTTTYTNTQPIYTSPPVQTTYYAQPPQTYTYTTVSSPNNYTNPFNLNTQQSQPFTTSQTPTQFTTSQATFTQQQPPSFSFNPQPSFKPSTSPLPYSSLAPPMQYVSPYLQSSQQSDYAVNTSLTGSSNVNYSGNVQGLSAYSGTQGYSGNLFSPSGGIQALNRGLYTDQNYK